MGLIKKYYTKLFLHRYDKDEAIPYYDVSDFYNLHKEDYSFVNTKGIEIKYFYYYYENYVDNKVILFCPGMGPGHTAYLAEINALCKAGYKVLTLDYSGCGESAGKTMYSVNAPTRDVNDLLNHLKLKEEIIPVGHSLGGYTALNIINIRKEISRAVVISGFLSIVNLSRGLTNSRFISRRIEKCEQKLDGEYFAIDNIIFLTNTTDKILFIQSEDDGVVNYKYALGVVTKINNPNIECVSMTNKGHNPTYTFAALKYMNETFSEYNKLLKNKKQNTLENRKKFMSDKSIQKMTEIDQEVMDKITNFCK